MAVNNENPIVQHVLANNSTSTLSISSSSHYPFPLSGSGPTRDPGLVACATVCGLFVISLSLCIPIAELVIGIKYQHQCPIQPKIPIYLIVAGSLTIFMLVTPTKVVPDLV
ncbi:unnamed protein product [Adineta steineri]|uniref:Uncharacterized protein n=1 Tax=Adineta steineri TaxID=433720 RepID=A0A815M6W2_9BILA|nr:unnamed protein product [Adineta steineri]CAF1416484.1 unnamed protein product [Adineta steineri]